ncbi:MAG: hypothetical protein V4503_02120 [Gemmatimonadota bacterium]
MFAGLLALATAVTAITTPVGPLRYKIEMKSSQEVDLSAMGAGKQVGEISAVAFLSVTMSDSAAGQLAHIVVDSMTLEPTGSMAAAYDPTTAAGAKGGFYHVYVVGGKVQGTPTPSVSGNPALSILAQAVTVMFPGTTRAGLKSGDSYTDTTTSTATTDAGTNNSTAVTVWTMKGMEGDAMMLEGESNGKMTIDGGQTAVSGTNKGTRKMTSTAKGPVKNAVINTTVDLAAVPSGMSDVIPVKGTSSLTVTLLP